MNEPIKLPGTPLDVHAAIHWSVGQHTSAAMRARLPELRAMIDAQGDRVDAAKAIAAARWRAADEAANVVRVEEAALSEGADALLAAERLEATQSASERQIRQNAEAATRAAEKKRRGQIEAGLIALGKQ